MSLLGLIPQPPGRVVSGEAIFDGRDLLKIEEAELRRIRGGAVAMVFQDPMTSLNPVFKVGDQIAEAIRRARARRDRRRRSARSSCSQIVGIPNPDQRVRASTRTSSRAACGSAR